MRQFRSPGLDGNAVGILSEGQDGSEKQLFKLPQRAGRLLPSHYSNNVREIGEGVKRRKNEAIFCGITAWFGVGGWVVRSIVRRGPLRSFDLAHLMLTRIVFPAARVSEFGRESAE
jgi:hypothetical protein